MGTRSGSRLRVKAVCRGEGCGYVAVVSRDSLHGLQARACLSDGTPIPCSLLSVEVPAERALLEANGGHAWIALVPLLSRACVITFFEHGETIEQYVFDPKLSKIASRVLTHTRPRVAALLRGFEQRRGAGRPRLFVREVWPASDGKVAWRLQAEFPTDDASLRPLLVVYDEQARAVDARLVCMEDHVAPYGRDDGLFVRNVTLSCLLDESLGNFYAVASLGQDGGLEAFACMNAPRAAGMLRDVRRFTAGAAGNEGYAAWLADRRATAYELERQRRAVAQASEDEWPLVSIVVLADKPTAGLLEQTVSSVRSQTYDRWELLIVMLHNPLVSPESATVELRDERVQVINVAEKTAVGGLDQGLEAAAGAYAAVLGVGDVLEPDALWCYAKAIRGAANSSSPVDALYCDEDCQRPDGTFVPSFKTFPNYGALYAQNYVGRMLMVSRYALDRMGRPSERVLGAQDYDLVLRAFEAARSVVHVPRILCHTCEKGKGVGCGEADVREAGRRALSGHLDRRGIAASVDDGPLAGTYRVRYELPQPVSRVSIVIPTSDHADLLRTCVSSILQRSTYPNYELVLVENGSVAPQTFALYDELAADERIRVVTWRPEGSGFNYSAVINYGAAHASGELLVLLNNDTEVIEPAWLEEMAGCLMRPEVGVVGAKLLFYDGLIQHVGMVANPNGDNCHVCQNLTRDALGPGGAAAMPGDYAMVTGACQMTRHALFDELGGYDERLAVGFNDGDYCLRAGEAGYAVAMAAHALLYHREFSTRGREVMDARLRERFVSERSYVMSRHPGFYANGDPAINKNLNGFSAYFDL